MRSDFSLNTYIDSLYVFVFGQVLFLSFSFFFLFLNPDKLFGPRSIDPKYLIFIHEFSALNL